MAACREFLDQLVMSVMGLCHRQSYHLGKKFPGQLVISAIEWGVVECLGKNARIG